MQIIFHELATMPVHILSCAVNYWKFQKWLIYVFTIMSTFAVVQMVCFSQGNFYILNVQANEVPDGFRDALILYSAGNFALSAQVSPQNLSGTVQPAAIQAVDSFASTLSRSNLAQLAILADAATILVFCLAWKYLVFAEKTEADYIDASNISVEKFALEFSDVPPDVTQGDLLEWLQQSVEVRVEKCHLVPNYNQLLQIVQARSEVLSQIDTVNQQMAKIANSAQVKLHSSLRIIEGADIEADISRARNDYLDRVSAAMVARQETGRKQLVLPREHIEQLLQPILARLHQTLGLRIQDEIRQRRLSKKMQLAQHIASFVKPVMNNEAKAVDPSPLLGSPSKLGVNRFRKESEVELESVSSSAECSPTAAPRTPPRAGGQARLVAASKQLLPQRHRQTRHTVVIGPTARAGVSRETSIQQAVSILDKRTPDSAIPKNLRPQVVELWNEREQLLNRCADLQTQLMTEYVSGHLVAAFVIFRTQADRDVALRRISEASSSTCFKRSNRFGFLGGPPLRARGAPKPSTIIWENLGFDQYEKVVRQALSRSMSGLLIIVTGLALYFALSFDVDFPFFTYLATFFVIVVNTLLENVIRSLVQAEKHRNTDEIEDGISRQLFIRLFLNTALLIVAINVNSTAALRNGVSAQSYSDLTPAWFRDVGYPLLVAMVYDIFLPFIPWAVEGTWVSCRAKLLAKDWIARPSQRELNSLLEGSDFAMAENYARITNVVFVCFMFSSGLPLLNLVGLATFLVSFWADKIWFCFFVRKPPSYSLKIGRAASESLLYASILHTITAIWLYSGTSFQLESRDISELNGYASWSAGAERFAQWQLVPHFMLLLIQFYWVLRQTLRLPPCFKCAQVCACLRAAEDAGLEEILQARGIRGSTKARELRQLKELHSKSYKECLQEGLLNGDFPDFAVQRNAAYSAAFTLLEEDPKGRAADALAVGLAEPGTTFIDIGYNNRIVKFNPAVRSRKSFQAKAGNALRNAMRRVSAVVSSTPKHTPKGRVVPMITHGNWQMRTLSANRTTLSSVRQPAVGVAPQWGSESDSSCSQ